MGNISNANCVFHNSIKFSMGKEFLFFFEQPLVILQDRQIGLSQKQKQQKQQQLRGDGCKTERAPEVFSLVWFGLVWFGFWAVGRHCVCREEASFSTLKSLFRIFPLDPSIYNLLFLYDIAQPLQLNTILLFVIHTYRV